MLALCLFGVALFPFYFNVVKKQRQQIQMFHEASMYGEQFLYSFQKTGKILETLKDVQLLFSKGRMKNVLAQAIDQIQHDYKSARVEKQALKKIEKVYSGSMLFNIHEFALRVEENGGEYHHGIQLLLEERSLWVDRMMGFFQEKKRWKRQVTYSIIASLFLCGFLVLLGKKTEIILAQHWLYQVSTTVVFALDIWIYYCAQKKLAQDWMEEQISKKEMYSLQEKYCKYQKKGGLYFGLIKKRLGRIYQQEFPVWMMQVSLLLQTENVQMAIAKSYDKAPVIMKQPLEKLLVALKQNPNGLELYQEFLEEFSIPFVQSSMKMLYSLSEGTGGNATVQIQDMIRRNQILYDQSEKMKQSDSLAGMYFLFLAPQITGGMKLFFDLLLLFVLYFKGMMG